MRKEEELMKRLEIFLHGRERPVEVRKIPVEAVVFDERVKLKCFYCEFYDACLKCPGNFPARVSPEACIKASENAALVVEEYGFDPSLPSGAQFMKSARQTQNTILDIEKFLFKEGYPLALGYFSGRCRQCEDCPEDRICLKPSRARISIEGAGVDVKATMERAGLTLSFSDLSRYKRVGLVCW